MADQIHQLEVGRIGKAHGIKGEVVVTFVSDRPERHAPGAVLRTDRGDLVVMASRPHQGKQLVAFEGITTRTEAETLRALLLYADPLDDPDVDDDTLWVHELIGCRVVDADGVARGTVVQVEANPASDLLVLDDETLVPLHFVVDGPTGGVLTVVAPRGLFDLDAALSDRSDE
jgi:16S rRNA processing protein RimM